MTSPLAYTIMWILGGLFQGEQDYISKVAKTEKDICALVEAGFE